MTEFNSFIESIEKPEDQETMRNIFNWMDENFPQLETTVKWNQPMYTDHGTFIIAFSKAKKHFSVDPESKTMEQFSERIEQADYAQTPNLFKIQLTQEINFDLLKDIITYNIEDKKDCSTFWRK
ncbi:DUF1801 domain-containing protein [Staphylococcus sp. Marseille-Q5304]|uniref:iron chaperone n=1 Tax=Staphylococcus sp. Marseille-Q5304 TaxID=2942200 RepID=UPI002074A038|nr:DUF1801 domain-containing protein [Staphylococcus sp. Marseille-Q5304]